jgi:hypothetical protein
MNKEQQELVYRAYDYYLTYLDYNQIFINSLDIDPFIRACKKDSEDAKMWGLTVEERELSLEERAKWLQDNKGYDLLVGNLDHDHIREVVEEESPTKIVTVSYNDKTIKSYE